MGSEKGTFGFLLQRLNSLRHSPSILWFSLNFFMRLKYGFLNILLLLFQEQLLFFHILSVSTFFSNKIPKNHQLDVFE